MSPVGSVKLSIAVVGILSFDRSADLFFNRLCSARPKKIRPMLVLYIFKIGRRMKIAEGLPTFQRTLTRFL
jgi:hypothetical protein